MGKVKQEIDYRIHQKEEEFDATRKVHLKAIENMQAAYESEAKAKAEAQRQWAKYKADIHELEISYDHTQKTYADLGKTVKKYEIEKEELAAALYEAETALENEENKVLKDQLEYSKVKQEIDYRIHQKEEEFDA